MKSFRISPLLIALTMMTAVPLRGQTDKAGHSQNFQHATELLDIVERFLDAVLKTVNLENTLVLVTSDHGNIEDLAFRGHTRNPAMTLVFGKGAEQIAYDMKTILDIYPRILSFFE